MNMIKNGNFIASLLKNDDLMIRQLKAEGCKKMKFIIKLVSLITLFSYSLLANEITIAFAKNGLNYGNKPSPVQIVDIEKIKKIANEKNIKVHFKAVPWKRALLMLEKGLIDGALNASYKDSRAKFSVYPMTNDKLDATKRINDGNTYYIYRHVNSLLRWDGKKFTHGGKVGVREKYAVIDDLKKHSNITIEEFVKNSVLIRKLSVNEIDGYAGASQETSDLIKEYVKFSKTIVKEPVPIRQKDYFLIFSKKTYIKKSKEMEQIWSGLQQINTKN